MFMDRDRMLTELIEMNFRAAERMAEQAKAAKTLKDRLTFTKLFADLVDEACKTIELQRRLARRNRRLERLKAEADAERPATPPRRVPKHLH